MPLIALIYGVAIRMYFLQSEHNPPHVHALYQGEAAAIAIADQRVLDGSLPPDMLKLACQWVARYRAELLTMWKTQAFKKLPGIR